MSALSPECQVGDEPFKSPMTILLMLSLSSRWLMLAIECDFGCPIKVIVTLAVLLVVVVQLRGWGFPFLFL